MINHTNVTKANYQHFFTEGPSYMQSLECFELENGQAIHAAVEYTYNTKLGLHATTVVWVDLNGQEINLASLPYQLTKWLHADLEKAAKIHGATYFEDAFNYFELGQV
jgi:hypothetical protein